MKPVLAMFGMAVGLFISLGMFAGGIAVAMFLPNGEPERRLGVGTEVADLWTVTPRSVDTAAQDFERLPTTQIIPPSQASEKRAVEVASAEEGGIDPINTSATAGGLEEANSAMPPAHSDWCADRYRSYRPEQNVYMAYSGELRTCVSPYLNEGDAASLQGASDNGGSYDLGEYDETYMPAAEEGYQVMDVAMSADHVNDCFSRYRSYRPEDNSYQPYDGGPRRQCQ